jgi:nickel-dependent lactate racemase
MNVDLPYGRSSKNVRVPDDLTVDFFMPHSGPVLSDPEAAFREACRHPVESPPLENLLGKGDTVLICISDLTRDPASLTLLLSCVTGLKSLGLAAAQIRVLIARGTHRKLTREEKQLFKEGALKGIAVEEHDCDDCCGLKALVLTTRGTPVRVNRALKESTLVLLLAPVSFHYFAGYGGGRKLILPGCADRPAILANHRLSLLDTKPVKLNPLCQAGSLDGNPVHEDMCEAIEALDNLFAVNFFSDEQGAIAFVNAGSARVSHLEACAAYNHRFAINCKTQYDMMLVSTGGYPHDINLLQSHKALKHASAAVKKGGTILLSAECEEGVGSEMLMEALLTPASVFMKEAYREYLVNNQAAVSLHTLAADFHIGMITSLDDEWLERCAIHRCSNAEAFIAEALSRHGSSRIAVMPYGSKTLPKFDEEVAP